MPTNLFDYFEDAEALPEAGADARQTASSPWAARPPRRPERDFDLTLFARAPRWTEDAGSVQALRRIAAEPWVEEIARDGDAVRVRLSDDWIELTGAALEAGGSAETHLADLADGKRVSMQFWDANATKALHVGHLRNLAIGNALSSALTQAGAKVERRSRISDMGRAMGEAMAGVMQSGRHVQGFFDGDDKSDHFVGECYADYVASGGLLDTAVQEQAEDSLSREVQVQNDAADGLIKRVLSGDREAVELWYRTRAWVIAGQRKTLARLGIAFDRVFFESDYLQETAQLTQEGLDNGTLKRREDGVVVYSTGFEELEELALVRSDGLSTQHMRSLTYCMTAPELEDMTSMQVTGSEWVSHVTSIRKLAQELRPGLNGGFHPSRSIFHGMVFSQKRAITSSAGALLIDELAEWIDRQINEDEERRRVRAAHPYPERIAAQLALAYFLPHAAAPDIDFDPARLLSEESLGWELARARARHGAGSPNGSRPTEDPDYRFAVVQSELYRRHLSLAIERLDVRPLAHYLKHLAIWYLERERSESVERVVHTLLDRSARGLGLEATP
ncbi:MAG TPA: arginine--tRNA ligase [Solirubrobacteraceae bacterium]|jgi:arginyl-tRNA synthetase|nr:arginine--tRNA ligase [Solirubrobacteraceae bacterium]